jgi:hypothetical protein
MSAAWLEEDMGTFDDSEEEIETPTSKVNIPSFADICARTENSEKVNTLDATPKAVVKEETPALVVEVVEAKILFPEDIDSDGFKVVKRKRTVSQNSQDIISDAAATFKDTKDEKTNVDESDKDSSHIQASETSDIGTPSLAPLWMRKGDKKARPISSKQPDHLLSDVDIEGSIFGSSKGRRRFEAIVSSSSLDESQGINTGEEDETFRKLSRDKVKKKKRRPRTKEHESSSESENEENKNSSVKDLSTPDNTTESITGVPFRPHSWADIAAKEPDETKTEVEETGKIFKDIKKPVVVVAEDDQEKKYILPRNVDEHGFEEFQSRRRRKSSRNYSESEKDASVANFVDTAVLESLPVVPSGNETSPCGSATHQPRDQLLESAKSPICQAIKKVKSIIETNEPPQDPRLSKSPVLQLKEKIILVAHISLPQDNLNIAKIELPQENNSPAKKEHVNESQQNCDKRNSETKATRETVDKSINRQPLCQGADDKRESEIKMIDDADITSISSSESSTMPDLMPLDKVEVADATYVEVSRSEADCQAPSSLVTSTGESQNKNVQAGPPTKSLECSQHTVEIVLTEEPKAISNACPAQLKQESEENFHLKASKNLFVPVAEGTKEPLDIESEYIEKNAPVLRNQNEDENFRLRASISRTVPVAEGNKSPDKIDLWLRNMSSENVWFEKAIVTEAENYYYSRKARLFKESGMSENLKNNIANSKKSQRTSIDELKLEYNVELNVPTNTEEQWLKNISNDFVWLDKLDVMEAERTFYTKLAMQNRGNDATLGVRERDQSDGHSDGDEDRGDSGGGGGRQLANGNKDNCTGKEGQQGPYITVKRPTV